ncbi:ribonuclease P protein component [Chryseobacterium caseinilyticum]|uniref:Ribonuclease P protein component n=1 Tax=Chryseobacterium caseinilyticum TaxID=2771428 RepID=A0ABR8ZDS8_9FLAO|nr:ribonuclease P protein component [Chryseobacterium caseinilyticum]MBD8083234.1 ribonuclease P protein component [Chryseobacterium caseinilyticum]
MNNFKYPAAEKLKGKNDISLLFEKGKWRTYGNLRIIILKNKETQPISELKFGVSVSKRYFKKAVDRNRFKRLLRECFRLNKDLYKEAFGDLSHAMLFWASSEKAVGYREVEEQFIKLCQAQRKK